MKALNPSNQPATTPDAPATSPSASGTGSAAERTTSSVKEMASQAKRKAGDVLGQAKERAASMAEEQKQSAAQHINRYGEALRDSAKKVEDQDPNIAYYANRAAEKIEQVADYVRNTDFEGLRRDAEDVARRNPALVMGGMFVAGLVLGALVRASAQTLKDEAQGQEGELNFDSEAASRDFPRDDEPLATNTPPSSAYSESVSQTSASL